MRRQPDNEVAITTIIFRAASACILTAAIISTWSLPFAFAGQPAMRLPENPMIARRDLCGKGYRHAGDWERSSG
jgi:hypothetical protein